MADKAYRIIDGKVVEVEVEGCASCGNTSGRFRIIDGKRYCVGKCAPAGVSRNLSTFPFVTTAFDGHPVEVHNLNHLRRLERQHGAHCAPYSWNNSNMDRGK